MAGIDLLPEVSGAEIKQNQLQRKINLAAIGSLLVVVAILFGLFGYWLFLISTLRRIDFQTKEAEEKIIADNRKEVTRRALVDKLKEARGYLSSATPYSISYEKLGSALSTAGVLLKDADFNDKSLTFTAESPDSVGFGALVDAITSNELSDVFDKLILKTLKKENQERPYSFSVEMEFLRKGIEGAPTGSK